MNQSSRTGGRRVLLATLLAMNTASAVCHAQAAASQTAPTSESARAAGPTVAIQPLTKYVLPDQTASVMLPDGWHVSRTGIAFIRAEGPKGEIGMFGVVVPARNAPGGDGNGVSPGAPLSQAYSADASEKLQQSILWFRAASGQGTLQIKVLSQAPFKAPAEFGSCSKMTATVGPPGGGVLAAEADFCSLPMDSAGNYRNFFKIVAISPALAATERGTMEAVLASYVLNMKAVQQQLAKRSASVPQSGRSQAAPANAPRPGQRQSLQQQIDAEIAAGGFSPQMVAAMRAQATAQANAQMAPMMHQMATFNQSIDYFDRSVLRGQIPVSITDAGTFWIDPN